MQYEGEQRRNKSKEREREEKRERIGRRNFRYRTLEFDCRRIVLNANGKGVRRWLKAGKEEGINTRLGRLA